MALDEIKIGITAELADFKRSMSELPDIGAQEARDMVRGIQRQLKEAEKAAAASGKQIKDDVGGSLEEVGDIAGFLKEKFNETFGVAGEAITEILSPLASATSSMGGLGAAGLAAGVGIAAAVTSGAILAATAKSIADAALEARDRLKEQGQSALIPASAILSMKQYEFAVSELNIALDELTVVLGGEISDDLAVLVSGLADLARWARDGGGVIDDLTMALGRQIPVLGPLADIVTGLWSAYRSSALAELEAARAKREHETALKDQLIQLGILDDEMPDFVRRSTAYTEATKESTAATKEQSQAEQGRHEAYVRAVEEQTAADLAYAQARVQAGAKIEAIIEDERQAYLQAFRDRQQARQQEIADEEERRLALEASALSSSLAMIGSTQSIADAVLSSYEQRAAAGENLTKAEEEAAQRAFAISQAAAIASATMSAFVIGANTIKGLTDLLVPFPIALAAGIAATGTVLSGQVASIAATAPPEFPTGLSPDHRTVRVQDEELIASRRASRMPEVREAVRRGNRGERPAQEGSAVGVHVSLDPRLGRLRVSADNRVGKKPPRRR